MTFEPGMRRVIASGETKSMVQPMQVRQVVIDGLEIGHNGEIIRAGLEYTLVEWEQKQAMARIESKLDTIMRHLGIAKET